VQINQKPVSVKTHAGDTASRITPLQQLVRSSLACMLWENSFYEDGESIAHRITALSHQVRLGELASLAMRARRDYKLRHVPLLLARNLVTHPNAKGDSIVSYTIADVIQRADELGEFLSLYWGGKKTPIAAQVKKGLAKAFTKFNEYHLAKYNRDKAVKLKDVLFMTHPKPINEEQADLWKRLVNDELNIPDTWEVALSTGKDKAESFTRLISEKKLPPLALLKNIRLMKESGVKVDLIRQAILNMKTERILPFRFITAAKYNPSFEDVLEQAMIGCLEGSEKLPGKTVLLVDVSGSMDAAISNKSELSRMDAAIGISVLAREMCEQASIYTFSEKLVQVPPRRGFALRDAIVGSQTHSSTYLGKALSGISEDYDRIIVFTDEQSHDSVPAPVGRGYMVNVASYENGVGYGKWHNITGFSESTVKYISEYEKEFN
jgi:60 kDa SS-A/Ro ribonucleoprotein